MIVIAVDTHCFQPFQPDSEWVEKVDQLNQPNPTRLVPIGHDLGYNYTVM